MLGCDKHLLESYLQNIALLSLAHLTETKAEASWRRNDTEQT